MLLIERGVPWDIAWELEPKRRRAMCVFYGLKDGAEYDFSRMRWKEKKPS